MSETDYPGVVLGRYPNATGTRVDSHPAVGTVQRILGLKVDNLFGPGTEGAVKAFQAANGLTADGIVGPGTWAKLVAPAPAPAPTPTPTPQPAPDPAPAPTPAPDGDRIADALERIEAKLDKLLGHDGLRDAMGV